MDVNKGAKMTKEKATNVADQSSAADPAFHEAEHDQSRLLLLERRVRELEAQIEQLPARVLRHRQEVGKL